MSLSESIKSTRQRAFMSQEMFASIIQVSIGTINRWENGKSKPNITAMKRIKDFCEDNELPLKTAKSKPPVEPVVCSTPIRGDYWLCP